MAKAFPDPGKGFPRSLEALRAAVKGGVIADSVNRTSGASAITLDADVYKHLITTGGTAGNEIVKLPVATEIGQKILIDFAVEGNAADVVRINDDGTSSLQRFGVEGGIGSIVLSKLIPGTEYAAGTSVWLVSPAAGRIRRVRSVVNTVTAGAGALALELATVKVTGSDVVVASGAVAGEVDDSGAITDSASNIIAAGDDIEITGDGVPTAGEVLVQVEIDVAGAVTNVDLDTPGEFALFEFQGGLLWNLLYTDGVTS